MRGSIYLFTVFRIPFHVEPWYLLLGLYMVSRAATVVDGLIWFGAVTLSIGVHELGHGLVARRFALQPSIVLHGWGGMTSHAPARRDRDDALIVAAGPTAGLLFGGLVFAGALGAEAIAPGGIAARPLLEGLVQNLLFVNLFWSVVNLLPMFPLDGGLLFRLGVHRVLDRPRAERVVHGTGLAFAVVWALAGWVLFHSLFLVIMGFFYAYENYTILSGTTRAPEARRVSPHLAGLLASARKAWADGDAKETARLCHNLRSGKLPPVVQDEMFTLLVLATEAVGDPASALSWARLAPVSGPVVEAQLRALVGLDRKEEARNLLALHESLLSAEARKAFAHLGERHA